MKKHFKIYLILGIALVFGLGMLFEWVLLRPNLISSEQRKIKEVLDIVSKKYVDNIDMDSLVELSIPNLLTSLDPHSVYIPSNDREAVDGELEGSFSGIGIEFRIENDMIVVSQVIPGGPSEKVGLMAGDRIIEIDDENVANIGIDEEGVRSRLRGKKDSKVVIKVDRDGVDQAITFDIVRGDVPMTSIDASYLLEDNIGYIKVNRFSRTTYAEFLQAIATIISEGADRGSDIDALVVDLRGNTGGYMEPALLMANEFLPADRIIVSTKGRDSRMNETVKSDGTGGLQNVRLVVLVDELTASASEIFSGAMQDNDRGLIMGIRTFGKGLVQQPIELRDGSEIRLTVQRYYTPSGRSIQKDYTPGKNDEYEAEIFERYRSGELMAIDSTKVNTNLIFKSSTGRELFGGGGILPDIFVPTDTIWSNSYLKEVSRKGLIQKFATENVSLNRPQLMQAKNIDELMSMLPSDEVLIWSFADYAMQNDVKPRWYYINLSAPIIVTQIKALIANDILGRNSFYEIYNTIDLDVKESLKALNEGKADFPITN